MGHSVGRSARGTWRDRRAWARAALGVLTTAIVVAGPRGAQAAALTQCPRVGTATGCAVLITLNPDGSTTLATDAASGNPYDGSDGYTVGVRNSSGLTVPNLSLSSNGSIFGFDGGGMCSSSSQSPIPAGCPFDSNTAHPGNDYAGPGITFSSIGSGGGVAASSGVVGFAASCSGGTSCSSSPGGLLPGATAFFSGDALPTHASFSVIKASPFLTSTPAAGAAGGTMALSAALQGGVSPQGTLTFNLFANDSCSGPPVGAGTAAVNGNGTYGSGDIAVSAAGHYQWVVSYTGDAGNNPTTTPCGAFGVDVAKASPTLSQAPTASPQNGVLSDSVSLGGTASAAGNITFSLYANDACSGSPAATAVAKVTGDGTYSSGNVPAAGGGTYRWIASYGGDANNNAAATPCGAGQPGASPKSSGSASPPGASPSVLAARAGKATPTITTGSSRSVALGSLVEAATIAGGNAPGGSVTFTVFGSPGCTGGPILTAVNKVFGNGTYSSGPLAVTIPGTYEVVAAYSGDQANAGVSSACGADAVTVAKALASLTVGGVLAGGLVTETASLTGGSSPTGAIVFDLYANAACSGAPFATVSTTVNGAGSYDSGAIPVPPQGDFHVVSTYSGDATNSGAASPCSVATTPAPAASASPGSPSAAAVGRPVAKSGSSAGLVAVLVVLALLVLAFVGWRIWSTARGRGAAVLVAGEEATGLATGLTRSRHLLGEQIGAIAADRSRLDDRAWEAIGDALARADFGLGATGAIMAGLRARRPEPASLQEALRQELVAVLGTTGHTFRAGVTSPTVWMVAGPPGAGTTSVVRRLGTALRQQGRKVILAAAGTEGAETSSLEEALDALGKDSTAIVVVDTAARPEVLREVRVAASTRAPVTEALLVVDATEGPQGVDRARPIRDAMEPTGLVVTKLDRTDRAAIVIAAQRDLGAPVKAVGVGEGASDLVSFETAAFVDAILERPRAEVT